MPQYKLTYFNLTVRGEVARMLFAVADQQYEDIRTEWELRDAATLSGTIFGQLPQLEVDGKAICQSRAINRYLAKQFGLAGKTKWDNARIDMVVDVLEDWLFQVDDFFLEPDEVLKAQNKAKCVEEHLPRCMSVLEKLLNENDSGFFVGDKMTWADITYSVFASFPSLLDITLDWSKYPKGKVLKNKVEAHPKIATWIAKRPKTPDFQ